MECKFQSRIPMKKNPHFFWMVVLLTACNQAGNPVSGKAPIDGLVDHWTRAWNAHDSLALRDLFEPHAVLVDGSIISKNREELWNKYIMPNINVVYNLRMEKLEQWSEASRAGYIGTFELEVIVGGNLVANPKGIITLNWKRNEQGDWKITNGHINSIRQEVQ
jgi:ketosteroid isomerase-like protein